MGAETVSTGRLPRRLDVVGRIIDISQRHGCQSAPLPPAEARNLLLASAAVLDQRIDDLTTHGDSAPLRDQAVAMGAAALHVSRLADPSARLYGARTDHLQEILAAPDRLVHASLCGGPDPLGRWRASLRRELESALAAIASPADARVAAPMRLALARIASLCIELTVWLETRQPAPRAIAS